MTLICFYCKREGVKQFASVFLGDCEFEGKKRKNFTLTTCTNKVACDKRKDKLPKKISFDAPVVVVGTGIKIKELADSVQAASTKMYDLKSALQSFATYADMPAKAVNEGDTVTYSPKVTVSSDSSKPWDHPQADPLGDMNSILSWANTQADPIADMKNWQQMMYSHFTIPQMKVSPDLISIISGT